jgi:hypothetical protein
LVGGVIALPPFEIVIALVEDMVAPASIGIV